jgi:hypothetical protein
VIKIALGEVYWYKGPLAFLVLAAWIFGGNIKLSSLLDNNNNNITTMGS